MTYLTASVAKQQALQHVQTRRGSRRKQQSNKKRNALSPTARTLPTKK